MKTSYSDRVFYAVNHVLLILLVIVTLYPLIYVAFASISDGAQLITHKGFLYRPLGFSLEAYNNVFKNPSILKGYRNTLLFSSLVWQRTSS
ncbi:hypothetical protein D3C85_1055700 [compost metagenome]